MSDDKDSDMNERERLALRMILKACDVFDRIAFTAGKVSEAIRDLSSDYAKLRQLINDRKA